ncbi:MAG: UDP-N-acetylmuramate:L-alanyl-gamma-D-glutamyl-meso-diaminopimelate ligase [Pseudomonadota bacterium]
MQHIHILGICGTFMGSLACLAVAKGLRVTGCDANVYPPMSTQLEQAGIELIEGYGPDQLSLEPDLFIIGNAMSRGNPLVEEILNRGLNYLSGPQWLREYILPGKWVLAVSGTHGKTTTSSMLAWILDYAGMSPGYLIGGVPNNFSASSRLGETPFFVIEADEYDSAFFDKRSKFVHYQPRTLIINNLEFDHADIFDDLAAIQRQFHHLIRTVPENGLIIMPTDSEAIDQVLERGCWTPQSRFSVSSPAGQPYWVAEPLEEDGSHFAIYFERKKQAELNWSQLGRHNIANGLAAMVAAHHVGVSPEISARALSEFKGVKRRLECIYESPAVKVYDDFAHHPTAIETTLAGLRARVGQDHIVALIEPRSNTMRMGMHQQHLGAACNSADTVLWYSPEELNWNIEALVHSSDIPTEAHPDLAMLLDRTLALVKESANKSGQLHIVIMSNGGFGGIHQQLIKSLEGSY